MHKMTSSVPTTLFTKIASLENVTCQACNSIEIAQGFCNPSENPNHLTCTNGVDCLLPPEAPSNGNGYRCPAETVVDECTLCKDMGGSVTCTYTYANGTSVTPPAIAMTDITGDLYLDVIAGIPKPNRCCLLDNTSGKRYSYYKETYKTSQNAPLVFPKSGQKDVDCGVTNVNEVAELGNFCDLAQTSPLSNYDINCSVS
jgi:hypothetical protein